jgi:hypothetical protein
MDINRIIDIVDKSFRDNIIIEMDESGLTWLRGRPDFLRSVWKELKKEELTNFDELMSSKIIWRDISCNISKEWWKKIGIIDNIKRFELFCDKNINIWLKDIETREQFFIKEGTISAGFIKANSLL